MTVKTLTLQLSTHGNADMLDITGAVQKSLDEVDLCQRHCHHLRPSSTSGLTTIEYESGALSDLKRLFDEIIPQSQTTRIMPNGATATAQPCAHRTVEALADGSFCRRAHDSRYLAADHLCRFRQPLPAARAGSAGDGRIGLRDE